MRRLPDVILRLEIAIRHREDGIPLLENGVRRLPDAILRLEIAIRHREDGIPLLENGMRHLPDAILHLENAIRHRGDGVLPFGGCDAASSGWRAEASARRPPNVAGGAPFACPRKA